LSPWLFEIDHLAWGGPTMGNFVKDRYRAEFIIEQPVEQVWASLEEEVDGQPQWLSAWPRIPGFEMTGSVVEVDLHHRLQVHKDSEPCKDSEITLTLEPTKKGTRVVVEQSNLPDWVQGSIDVFVMGGDQITADLILFLDRGIQVSRHSMPWAFGGLMVREVGTGLEVTAAVPGTFADKVGLREGDLVVTLGGAPLFTQHCLQTALRILKSGDETECCWVRGTELLRASSVL
jgi:uncharacterized protein YndB with AHSA1/START domain